MKGLRIEYDGRDTVVGPKNSSEIVTLMILIGKGEDSFSFHVSGYDPVADAFFDWIKEDFKESKKMTIDFLDDLQKIDEPISKRFGDSENFVNQEKVKYFYRLKAELEKKGLI